MRPFLCTPISLSGESRQTALTHIASLPALPAGAGENGGNPLQGQLSYLVESKQVPSYLSCSPQMPM
jgi:hypothetical protein